MASSTWPDPAASRVVTDIQYEQLVAAYADSGIQMAAGDSAFAYADGSGRLVKIRANKIAVVGAHGYNSGTTDLSVNATTNASGSTRIDRLVLGLSRTTWKVTEYVKAGTPGSGLPPTMQQDSAAGGTGLYEIPILRMTLPNGYTSIGASDVQFEAPILNAQFKRAIARNPPATSIVATTSTWTPLTFASGISSAAMSWASGTPTRLTATVRHTALMTILHSWEGDSRGNRATRFKVNGASVWIASGAASPYSAMGQVHKHTLDLIPGDYVEVDVMHDIPAVGLNPNTYGASFIAEYYTQGLPW